MADVYKISTKKYHTGKRVVDYKEVNKRYKKFVRINDRIPTGKEFAELLGIELQKAYGIANRGDLKLSGLQGVIDVAERFEAEYPKMCEGDYRPSSATAAERLGISQRSAASRISKWHKEQEIKKLEEEKEHRFEKFEVYAGPMTMQRLVEQVNRRENI